jgi:hypothetical protein
MAAAIDIVKLTGRIFVLGEKKNIGLWNIHRRDDADLTGITATVTIFDSVGNTTLAATAMTMAGSGTPYMSATYLLTTGSGQTITAAGTYRAIYTVTYGSEVQIWEQALLVNANPFT